MSVKNSVEESDLPDPYNKPDTLLKKYDIPLNHLEFDYIEKCTNASEIEKIVHILNSGEEGYYPQLTKAAENRLVELKPKSKLLRKDTPILTSDDLSKKEWNELSQSLNNFVNGVSRHNKELVIHKTNINTGCNVEIRKCREMKSNNDSGSCKEVRIRSTDYASWDKYDPDTEILKMDLTDEAEKQAAITDQRKKQKSKKQVTFNKFSTETEAHFMSDREREKGNEYFKAGDYLEALQCYTNSVATKTSVTNLNNRAAVYLKLEKYQLALDDCEKLLEMEPDNFKGQLRMAHAFEGLKKYDEALDCVGKVIRMEPNCAAAQQLAGRVRKHCPAKTTTRMKIVELDD